MPIDVVPSLPVAVSLAACGSMPFVLLALSHGPWRIAAPGRRFVVAAALTWAAWLCVMSFLAPVWVDFVTGALLIATATLAGFTLWTLIAWGFTLSMLLALSRAERPLSVEEWALAHTRRQAARGVRSRSARRAVAMGLAEVRGDRVVMTRLSRASLRASSRGTPHTLRASAMTGLFVGLVCFALHVAVSLVWLRLPGGLSPVARHAISALGTHVVGVVTAGWLGVAFAYWPAAAVSGFCAVCWLFAFSAVYKSVSLRILAELDRSPDASLPLETITDEYVRPEFESSRRGAGRMGCAEDVEDGYAITSKGNRIARRIALVQRAFGISASGLYNASPISPPSPG